MKKEFKIKYNEKNVLEIARWFRKNKSDLRRKGDIFIFLMILDTIFNSRNIFIKSIGKDKTSENEKKYLVNILIKNVYTYNNRVIDQAVKIIRRAIVDDESDSKYYELCALNSVISFISEINQMDILYLKIKKRNIKEMEQIGVNDDEYVIDLEPVLDNELDNAESILKRISDRLDHLVHKMVYQMLIEKCLWVAGTVNSSIDKFNLKDLYTKKYGGKEDILLIDYGMKLVFERKIDFEYITEYLSKKERQNRLDPLIEMAWRDTMPIKDLNILASLIKYRHEVLNEVYIYASLQEVATKISNSYESIVKYNPKIAINENDLLSEIGRWYADLLSYLSHTKQIRKIEYLDKLAKFKETEGIIREFEINGATENGVDIVGLRKKVAKEAHAMEKAENQVTEIEVFIAALHNYRIIRMNLMEKSVKIEEFQAQYINNQIQKEFALGVERMHIKKKTKNLKKIVLIARKVLIYILIPAVVVYLCITYCETYCEEMECVEE